MATQFVDVGFDEASGDETDDTIAKVRSARPAGRQAATPVFVSMLQAAPPIGWHHVTRCPRSHPTHTHYVAGVQVAWFTVVDTGRRIKLHEGLNTVGRVDGNDVVLRHDSLSGEHAHVEANIDDELYTVKDLGVRAWVCSDARRPVP